jgi:hypothetical protein
MGVNGPGSRGCQTQSSPMGFNRPGYQTRGAGTSAQRCRRASARTLALYRAHCSAIGASAGRKVVRARDELRECCGLELPRLDEQREHSAKSRGDG